MVATVAQLQKMMVDYVVGSDILFCSGSKRLQEVRKMATYKSAKKQLAWAMQVIENEIKNRKETFDIYADLLEEAQAKRDEKDISFWLEALTDESAKLRTLESLYFDITHPDIYDSDWK